MFIAGFKDAQLVRSGPYAALRHPLYALSMLAMLGLGLATRSVAITLVCCSSSRLIYVGRPRRGSLPARRARREFARYAAKCAPSCRAGPLRGARVPRSAARVLWKAFLDAGSLLGLWALLVAADALQRAGLTPTWITLP